MPWCALLTAVKNYNKSLENCKTFSSRPRPDVQDQDFMIQDQEQGQDFHFCPRGASRPRPCSRGLPPELVKWVITNGARVKFGRYFVQHIVRAGIPSSLPFSTNVVPKMEWKLLVWRKLEYRGLIRLLLCCLLYRCNSVSTENYISVVMIQIIIFKGDT